MAFWLYSVASAAVLEPQIIETQFTWTAEHERNEHDDEHQGQHVAIVADVVAVACVHAHPRDDGKNEQRQAEEASGEPDYKRDRAEQLAPGREKPAEISGQYVKGKREITLYVSKPVFAVQLCDARIAVLKGE